MPWMRKAEREKIDAQYDAIMDTLRQYPGIFFDELSERSGVPRPRLKPCINYLLRKKKIAADRRYHSGTEQMANKYRLVDDERRKWLGITPDDFRWMEYYRRPRIERLRERMGVSS